MTRIIGITGGIGSGKSTLADRFAYHGIPVFDADALARQALAPQSECFSDVVALFGTDVLRPDGTFDRAAVAQRVFHDQDALRSLNAIVHPFVIRTLIKQSESCLSPLAVWDVPLLFESGCDAFCACTVAVLCSEEIRIARVMARDGATVRQVRARIKEQITDEQREALATYTIRNEADFEAFLAEADSLIERIRKELT